MPGAFSRITKSRCPRSSSRTPVQMPPGPAPMIATRRERSGRRSLASCAMSLLLSPIPAGDSMPRRSVVVPMATDGVTRGSGDPEHGADDHEHETDDPQDGHAQEQTQQQQDHTEHDHVALSWSGSIP